MPGIRTQQAALAYFTVEQIERNKARALQQAADKRARKSAARKKAGK